METAFDRLGHLQTWVNNAGNEFRFGPTDLVPIPGIAGHFAVSTHGGLAYVVSPTGMTLDTPLLDFNSEASATYSPGFAATPIQANGNHTLVPGL